MDSVAAKAHQRINNLSEHADILETKIKRLEKFLAERKKKHTEILEAITRLRAFVEIYGDLAEGEGHLPGHGFRNKKHQQTLSPGHAFRPGSNSEQIEKVVVNILSENKKPITIGRLLDKLEAREGKIVTGERPRTALAAILSRSRKVYYNHPYGWMLTEEGKEGLTADDSTRNL